DRPRRPARPARHHDVARARQASLSRDVKRQGVRMTAFSVGKASIIRVEETYGPTYPVKEIFSACTDAILAEHGHWLAPSHYDAASGKIKLSVHSWLLEVGGQKILIDCCCGNNKVKPGRPFWNMLNTPYLERLAAAGARPQDIDFVMCTHLHHDHVGWNT